MAIGGLTLRNLRLKKEALDKFKLPVDVLEGMSANAREQPVIILAGFVGEFTMKVPWATMTSKPIEVSIDSVYILVVPSAESKVHYLGLFCYLFMLIPFKYDKHEDERRAQAAKQEKLQSAELLDIKAQAGPVDGACTRMKTMHRSDLLMVSRRRQISRCHHVGYNEGGQQYSSQRQECPCALRRQNELPRSMHCSSAMSVSLNILLASFRGWYDTSRLFNYFYQRTLATRVHSKCQVGDSQGIRHVYDANTRANPPIACYPEINCRVFRHRLQKHGGP